MFSQISPIKVLFPKEKEKPCQVNFYDVYCTIYLHCSWVFEILVQVPWFEQNPDVQSSEMKF
jgi:hypothetical protein